MPNEAINIAIFDHLDDRKFFVEINGTRYPRDAFDLDYTKHDNLNQIGKLRAFFRENEAEPMINPSISYTDMRNFYPIQLIDLKFHVDRVSPKKNKLFEEDSAALTNARVFVVLLKHRQIKVISDGQKVAQFKSHTMTILSLKDFMQK